MVVAQVTVSEGYRVRLVPVLERISSAVLTVVCGLWTAGCVGGEEFDDRVADVDGRRSAVIAESPPPEMVSEARSQGADVTDAIEMRYDPALDQLTVRARNVSLATLLERLVAVTGVEIVMLEPLQLDESISIEYEGALSQVFDVLLRGFGRVVISSSKTSRSDEPVVRVLVAGRREATRGRGEPGEGAESASQRVRAGASRPAVSEDPALALLQAVEMEDSDLAVRIVDELIENGAETEKDRAVESLVESVDVTTLPGGFAAPVEKLVTEQALNSSDPEVRETAADTQATMVDAAQQKFLSEVAAMQRELRAQYQ